MDRQRENTVDAESYDELKRRLTSAVDAVTPLWLANQRDDVVQEALLRVHRLLERSEGERSFTSSYIWRVAHSALVDEIRRARRRRETPLDSGGGVATMKSSNPGPEQQASGREQGRLILDCLDRLVRPRRLAATLYLQGHTVPESARLLGFSTKKTENLVYRGLANLRRCLKEKGLEP